MEHPKFTPATIYFDVEPDGPVLMVRGSVVGTALNKLAEALDVVLNNHHGRITVDVSDVDDWSLLAQAMLLVTARRKSDHDGRLVLRGASEKLRCQSQQLGVFERIEAIDAQQDTSTWRAAGGSGAYAAPLAGGDR